MLNEIENLKKIHLGISKNPATIEDGRDVWSSLITILRDARKVTGRNIDSGVLPEKVTDWKDGDPGSWIGAIAYMTAIDQLGSAYGTAKENNLRWQEVLTRFGGLSEEQAVALYKLRCCFVHEASLVDANPKYPIAFLVSGSGEPLISSPMSNWDGDIELLRSVHATKVDLRTFGNVVEKCVEAHRECFLRGELSTTHGIAAFSKKFLIGTSIGAAL